MCASSGPRRTARTLASGPCGPGLTFSIMGRLPAGRSGHVAAAAVRPSESGRLVQAVVRVAPSPVLAGFGGPDHRMARRAEVGRGMPVRAPVAAARLPAGQALAQVLPGGADLDARGQTSQRRVDPMVGFEVLAERRHVAARPMCPRPGGSPLAGPRSADTTPEPCEGRARRPDRRTRRIGRRFGSRGARRSGAPSRSPGAPRRRSRQPRRQPPRVPSSPPRTRVGAPTRSLRCCTRRWSGRFASPARRRRGDRPRSPRRRHTRADRGGPGTRFPGRPHGSEPNPAVTTWRWASMPAASVTRRISSSGAACRAIESWSIGNATMPGVEGRLPLGLQPRPGQGRDETIIDTFAQANDEGVDPARAPGPPRRARRPVSPPRVRPGPG